MEYGWKGALYHQDAKQGLAGNNTAVQRMLQEEDSRTRSGQPNAQSFAARLEPRRPGRSMFEWPPRRSTVSAARDEVCPAVRQYFSSSQPADIKGLKKVTWPPPPEDIEIEEREPVFAQEAPAVNGFTSPTPQFAQQQAGRIQNQPPQPPQQLQQPVQRPQRAPHARTPPSPPPTLITLRQSPPLHQQPAPVVVSQPATARMQGGVRARGDAKWPPAEYKTRADEENANRVALARGPVCRPRRVQKDYSTFFNQHALNDTYPGYRAPPGTQHYSDETGVSEF